MSQEAPPIPQLSCGLSLPLLHTGGGREGGISNLNLLILIRGESWRQEGGWVGGWAREEEEEEASDERPCVRVLGGARGGKRRLRSLLLPSHNFFFPEDDNLLNKLPCIIVSLRAEARKGPPCVRTAHP